MFTGDDGLADLVAGGQRNVVSFDGTVAPEADNDSSEEDEWAGAQIVVVKEVRHLTEEEVIASKKVERKQQKGNVAISKGLVNVAPSGQCLIVTTPGSRSSSVKRKRTPISVSDSDEGQAAVASTLLDTAGRGNPAPSPKKKARKPIDADAGTYEGLKELLARQKVQEKTAEMPGQEGQSPDIQEVKTETKKAKPEQTRKNKKKAGKGLSFDYDN